MAGLTMGSVLVALCLSTLSHGLPNSQRPFAVLESPPVTAQATPTLKPYETWNLDDAPSINATGHLVFHSVASLLQHWPNTLYRNGHTLVPGTIAPGTLLYHGAAFNRVPTEMDWVATDPEHANMFCMGTRSSGCLQVTFMAKRELKVLYFDGTSAGKMDTGTMDTQDVVAFGRVLKGCGIFGDIFRIRGLCEWGEKYGLDGFVRMEMDFEIMLCNFTKSTEIVSKINLPYDGPELPVQPPAAVSDPIPLPTDCAMFTPPPTSPRTTLIPSPSPPAPSPVPPIDLSKLYPQLFRVTESGLWHGRYPGEHRVRLDLTGLISFFDSNLFPSLIPTRQGKERWEYRVDRISKDDVEMMYERLDEALHPSQELGSGVDWRVLTRVVIDRYGKRLELLQHLLRGKEYHDSSGGMEQRLSNWTAIAIDAHKYLEGMLKPHIPHNVIPPANESQTSDLSWATPVLQHCATIHTSAIETTLHSKITPSERLILNSIKQTEREICRVLVRAWAEGAYLSPEGFSDSGLFSSKLYKSEQVVKKWEKEISGLMDWLGWDMWVQCLPACGYEEMCYLPSWPFFYPDPSLPQPPPEIPDPSNPFPSPPEGKGKPKPFCIRRLPPYTKLRR